jgi:multidrug efflux pump subunit AcrB
LEGAEVGLVHIPKENRPVQVRLRLPIIERTGLEHLGEISLRTTAGSMVPLSELIRVEQTVRETAIYHKNQKPVVYVIADVGGVGRTKVRARSMV